MPDLRADIRAELRAELRAAGLRCTPARVRVLGAIRSFGRPASHAELADHAEVVGMDAVTLYRSLSALEGAGLLHRVHGTDGAWRACAQPEGRDGCPGNHAHFLCSTCGQMACLVDQPLPRVMPPPGAVVQGRNFVAFGRCAQCRAAGADGDSRDRAP